MARTDQYSGPTVEKGLAALDSLYELRNVIPGLITTSDLGDQEGEPRDLVFGDLRLIKFSLEYILAPATACPVQTVHECQPTYPATRHHLSAATFALHTIIFFPINLSHLRSRLVPNHGRTAQIAKYRISRNPPPRFGAIVQSLFGGR